MGDNDLMLSSAARRYPYRDRPMDDMLSNHLENAVSMLREAGAHLVDLDYESANAMVTRALVRLAVYLDDAPRGLT